MLRADLHGLDAALSFGPRLEDAVIDNSSRGRRRLRVDNGALLGGRVANHIEFSGLRIGSRRRDGDNNAGQHKRFHVLLQFRSFDFAIWSVDSAQQEVTRASNNNDGRDGPKQ